MQGLSCRHSGELWVSVPVGGRPSNTSRVVDCHSVEELGFQLLNRKDMILLQGSTPVLIVISNFKVLGLT
jgi:hypothetical protein